MPFEYYTKADLKKVGGSDRGSESENSSSEEESEREQQMEGILRFGMSALTIKDDFKVVTSDLANEQSFALNGDPKYRGKVRSLIEPLKTYKPKKMELWIFKDSTL